MAKSGTTRAGETDDQAANRRAKALVSPAQQRTNKACEEMSDPSKTSVERIHSAARYRGGK